MQRFSEGKYYILSHILCDLSLPYIIVIFLLHTVHKDWVTNLSIFFEGQLKVAPIFLEREGDEENRQLNHLLWHLGFN